MCVGVPARIIKIEGDVADVEVGGAVRKAGLYLLENPQVGQYMILHAGLGIQILDEEEAKKTLRLLRKISEVY